METLKQKAGKLAAKAAEGGKMAIRAAVNKVMHGELDEDFKQVHERLLSVLANWNALHAALKHQGERARKTAKTLRDETGEPLMQRADDTEEALTKRLQGYHEQTVPILAHYAPAGVVSKVRRR